MVDPVPLALTFGKLAIDNGEKERFFDLNLSSFLIIQVLK
jgi:hypothetical protein